VLLVAQSGCTSALSTALLRDMPWDGVEHAAEADKPDRPDAPGDDSATATAPSEPAPHPAETAAARAAAIEEAMKRLSASATLDAAAEAALVEILRSTPQEDWPVVIEEFTASLAASPPAAAPATAATVATPDQAIPPTGLAQPRRDPPDETTPASVTVSDASAAAPAAVATAVTASPAPVEPALAAETAPAAEPAATTPAPAVEPGAVEPGAVEPGAVEPGAVEPGAVEPAPVADPSPAALAIRNACFASRVRGWGAVDRFAESRFQPGQELIVYFELDNLSADESAAGHTTRIDTSLRLVGVDGTLAHAWSFEPITETCPSRRRDYFARYLVRLPEGLAPGDCRVELAVTDTLARVTATASLPCAVTRD
jgi:hypothetical protein